MIIVLFLVSLFLIVLSVWLFLNDVTITIVISKAVRFHWLPHRLTLKCNPPIYHWLWFTFSSYRGK